MLFGALVGIVLQQLKFRRERGSAGMSRKGKAKMPRSGGRSPIVARFAIVSPDIHSLYGDGALGKEGIVAVFALTGGIAA